MATTDDLTVRPATSSEDELVDRLACALLWVDLAAISLHAGGSGRTAHGLTQARAHLRAAIRHLKSPS
ncbi:MAG TPA: hypothetical protein VM638_07855 [Actinomycetota bacterium]|nr:hypothetical protein [Actinomycetota bacterium]